MSLNVAYQRRLQSKYEMKVEVHLDYWYAHSLYKIRLLFLNSIAIPQLPR